MYHWHSLTAGLGKQRTENRLSPLPRIFHTKENLLWFLMIYFRSIQKSFLHSHLWLSCQRTLLNLCLPYRGNITTCSNALHRLSTCTLPDTLASKCKHPSLTHLPSPFHKRFDPLWRTAGPLPNPLVTTIICKLVCFWDLQQEQTLEDKNSVG